MMAELSRHALINGKRFSFVKLIESVNAHDAPVVVCSCDGEERYASVSDWERGSDTPSSVLSTCDLVTSASPAKDKIALFRSLFRGRSDVYAHGYKRKDGGIGYTPACANEWKRGICSRASGKKIKCALCNNQAFSEISDAALIAHFKGADERFRDVIGMYVLDKDCKTSVLVLDFDGKGWTDAVKAIHAESIQCLMPAYIERSRSGNGAHVWFFFDAPVDASLARELGNYLISRAMMKSDSIGFDAYDRMFPAQSTIPEGGFGNLIALPFQGASQRKDNSVFVDSSFEVIPDQWFFLSQVERISEEHVRALLKDSSSGIESDAFDSLLKENCVDEERILSSSWKARVPIALSSDDFSNNLTVTEADMIYIPEDGMSPAARNCVKRLAAFSNPEFYRAQAMHQSVYGKPRIAYFGETRGGCIALPRGCKSRLIDLLNASGICYVWNDCRFSDASIDVQFKGELRLEQKEAAENLLKYENGILSAPTGFGKTVIGAYLIAQLRLPTLVIVPKTALVSQWIDKLTEFLDIRQSLPPLLTPSGKISKRKRPLIGKISGGKNAPSGIIDVATFQSLVIKGGESEGHFVKDLSSYGLVICDECHHAAALQLENVLKSVPAKVVYGLSATPKRSDGMDAALFMLCGPISFKVDPKEQAKQQGISRVLIPRFIGFRIHNPNQGDNDSLSFNQVLDCLCAHHERNVFIARDVVNAIQSGRFPLVLTKRKEHARLLCEAISEQGAESRLLVGGGTEKQRRDSLASLVEIGIDNDYRYAIVATESYLGEGFDLARLDALFLATPISWDGNVTQQAGRLHRSCEGKSDVVIYDYIETSVPMLERMYRKRLKTYAKLGYEVAASDDSDQYGRVSGSFVLYDEATKKLLQDIARARKSILFRAQYASAKAVSIIAPSIADASSRGVKVTCLLEKASSDDAVDQLAKAGADIKLPNEIKGRSNIAIFDESLIWYGSIPLLAFPKKDDCAIRFQSIETAHDLLCEMKEL